MISNLEINSYLRGYNLSLIAWIYKLRCIVFLFFLELFIMKEGLCAVTPDLYGDWSPYVSGKHPRSVHQDNTFTLAADVAQACVLFCSWSGSHIKWGQSFRIRHITTGRYLFLDEDKGLLLVDAEKAISKMSAFCFRISKVTLEHSLWNFRSKVIFFVKTLR